MMRPTLKRSVTALLCFSLPALASAFNWRDGFIPIQAGGFWSIQGENQNINYQGLIGNQYTGAVEGHDDADYLLGTGYYINGQKHDRYQLAYGVNVFYLAQTGVTGSITQEHVFTNLNYTYKIQNVPLYFATKAFIKTKNEKVDWTFDAGIGPNFMFTSAYQETPLNTYTTPSNTFTSNTTTTFTATVGVGLRFNQLIPKLPVPLECGYRFYYLGQGHMTENNNQLLNTLNTGDVYANALLCAIAI